MSVYGNSIFEHVVLQEGIVSKLKSLFKKKDSKENKEIYPKTCFYIYSESKPIGSIEKVYKGVCNTSISREIKVYIASSYGCVDNNNKLVVYKKHINELSKDKAYLYKLNITKFNEDENKYECKIVSLEAEGTCEELLKKYSIDFEIKDTDQIEKQRNALYQKLVKYGNEAIKAAKVKGYSVKGFKIADKDEYYYKDFAIGLEDYISIIDCDAWEATDEKARNDEEYDKYIEVFEFIYSYFDNKIKLDRNIKGRINYGGDWDGGCIDFEIINSN